MACEVNEEKSGNRWKNNQQGPKPLLTFAMNHSIVRYWQLP
jgi:hypothetical protein